METDEKRCPDCKGEMVEGFILDMTYGGKLVPRWLRGHPESSWWQGVKTGGRECRTVATYRCVGCGLLRSYATTEVDPPGMWG
jgi:hypothetical protein